MVSQARDGRLSLLRVQAPVVWCRLLLECSRSGFWDKQPSQLCLLSLPVCWGSVCGIRAVLGQHSKDAGRQNTTAVFRQHSAGVGNARAQCVWVHDGRLYHQQQHRVALDGYHLVMHGRGLLFVQGLHWSCRICLLGPMVCTQVSSACAIVQAILPVCAAACKCVCVAFAQAGVGRG